MRNVLWHNGLRYVARCRAKRPVLHAETGCFAPRNGLFCRAERPPVAGVARFVAIFRGAYASAAGRPRHHLRPSLAFTSAVTSVLRVVLM